MSTSLTAKIVLPQIQLSSIWNHITSFTRSGDGDHPGVPPNHGARDIARRRSQKRGAPEPPVALLPNEILEEIFLLILPDRDNGVVSANGTELKNALKNIALVCRRWKEVVYGNGIFWKTDLSLAFNIPPKRNPNDPEPKDLVDRLRRKIASFQKALKESDQSDLRVVVSAQGIRSEEPHEVEKLLADAFALLEPHSRRLRDIYIGLGTKHIASLIGKVLRRFNNLGRLDYVRVMEHSTDWRTAFRDDGVQLDFSCAVQLQRIELETSDLLRLVKPPKGLQSVESWNTSTSSNSWVDFSRFFFSCSEIKSITINSTAPFSDSTAKGDINMHNLEHLKLKMPIPRFEAMGRRFDAPRLRTLNIHFASVAGFNPFQGGEGGPRRFIFPHFPLLSNLSVTTHAWDPAFEEFLNSSPPSSLAELSISIDTDTGVVNNRIALVHFDDHSPLVRAGIKTTLCFSAQQQRWDLVIRHFDFSATRRFKLAPSRSRTGYRPFYFRYIDTQDPWFIDLPAVETLELEDLDSEETDMFSRLIRAPLLTAAKITSNDCTHTGHCPFPALMLSAPQGPYTPLTIYTSLSIVEITSSAGLRDGRLRSPCSMFPNAVSLTLELCVRRSFDQEAADILAPLGDDMSASGKLRRLKVVLWPLEPASNAAEKDRQRRQLGTSCRDVLCQIIDKRARTHQSPLEEVLLYTKYPSTLFWSWRAE